MCPSAPASTLACLPTMATSRYIARLVVSLCLRSPLLPQASPLFQLQVLFAFLQTSQQAVYDPEPLVASLRLDQNEQQDAQEFAKLFTQRLDHEFKKQGARLSAEGGNPDVANLVQTQVSSLTPRSAGLVLMSISRSSKAR